MTDAPETRKPDEFELIRWVRARINGSPLVPIGPGDDCAALRVPPGSALLVTTDMLIAGVHFAPDVTSPFQAGHKAMARGLSDIAAMAGDALAVVVAVAAPNTMAAGYFQELFRGMMDVADRFGVRLIGGDISSGDLPLTLTVTALGAGPEETLVRRSGARVGDMLMVTGDLGGSLLGKHVAFLPRLTEAKWLRSQAELHAMIDVSDGLAADAAHVAEESGVAIELWEEAVPISSDARKAAETSGKAPLEHALNDGEDYELLFTVSSRDAERLMRLPDPPVRVSCIGEVVAGTGLFIRRRCAERRTLAPEGWVHRFH
jgi:thiamine-monophosphate kinase